jgi:hypothetical protein
MDAVHIRLPAKVAFNLDALQQVVTGLAERLGCERCFSGRNCLFELERQFLINERLEISAAAPVGRLQLALPQDPVPLRTAKVQLAKEVAGDIDALKQAIAAVTDKLGHRACFSGFDVLFGEEFERILSVDQKLNVNAFN